MLATQRDHFKVITDSLSGLQATNEETLSSVAVLAERLERLKKISSLFGGVTFSPQLEELESCELISAIC